MVGELDPFLFRKRDSYILCISLPSDAFQESQDSTTTHTTKYCSIADLQGRRGMR